MHISRVLDGRAQPAWAVGGVVAVEAAQPNPAKSGEAPRQMGPRSTGSSRYENAVRQASAVAPSCVLLKPQVQAIGSSSGSPPHRGSPETSSRESIA